MAQKPVFKVGNLVKFHFGPTERIGVVKEDRGAIGKGGRRLYAIQYDLDPPTQAVIEIPEEELELADAKAGRP